MANPTFTARLGVMRAHAESGMPDTCDLYNAATPRAVMQSSVMCRVTASPGAPLSFTAPDRPEVIGQWTISLPVGTDVAPGWQVRMKADTTSVGLRGRIFTVMGDLAGSYCPSNRVLATEGQ
jgi:hypothetical protein